MELCRDINAIGKTKSIGPSVPQRNRQGSREDRMLRIVLFGMVWASQSGMADKLLNKKTQIGNTLAESVTDSIHWPHLAGIERI